MVKGTAAYTPCFVNIKACLIEAVKKTGAVSSAHWFKKEFKKLHKVQLEHI